jgi:hypothetical protein
VLTPALDLAHDLQGWQAGNTRHGQAAVMIGPQ